MTAEVNRYEFLAIIVAVVAMSALGVKSGHSSEVSAMSALTPKAEMALRLANR